MPLMDIMEEQGWQHSSNILAIPYGTLIVGELVHQGFVECSSFSLHASCNQEDQGGNMPCSTCRILSFLVDFCCL